MEDFKTCTRCGEKKNILLFAKKRNHCKECRSEIQREWSRANPISDEKRKAKYEQQKIWKKKKYQYKRALSGTRREVWYI